MFHLGYWVSADALQSESFYLCHYAAISSAILINFFVWELKTVPEYTSSKLYKASQLLMVTKLWLKLKFNLWFESVILDFLLLKSVSCFILEKKIAANKFVFCIFKGSWLLSLVVAKKMASRKKTWNVISGQQLSFLSYIKIIFTVQTKMWHFIIMSAVFCMQHGVIL